MGRKAKFDAAGVEELRSAHAAGATKEDLAARYSCSVRTIEKYLRADEPSAPAGGEQGASPPASDGEPSPAELEGAAFGQDAGDAPGAPGATDPVDEKLADEIVSAYAFIKGVVVASTIERVGASMTQEEAAELSRPSPVAEFVLRKSVTTIGPAFSRALSGWIPVIVVCGGEIVLVIRAIKARAKAEPA